MSTYDQTNPHNGTGAQQANAVPTVKVQRMYLKRMSLEIPNGTDAFKQQGQFQVKLDLNNIAQWLEGEIYETILTLKAQGEINDQVIYSASVDYAIIAELDAFMPEMRDRFMNTQLLSMLYPYAIERLNNIVGSGSFPAIQWTPINFEQLYDQKKNAVSGSAYSQAPAVLNA